MADGFLRSIEGGWEREMAAKRRKADEKGAAADLAAVTAKLDARLPASWEQSTSRDEIEVTAIVGGLSIRVRRRNRGEGAKRWHCTAWARGPAEGLLVAKFVDFDAEAALVGALKQVADLWVRLGEALGRERADG